MSTHDPQKHALPNRPPDKMVLIHEATPSNPTRQGIDLASMQVDLTSAPESQKRTEHILSSLNITADAGNNEPLIRWNDNTINNTSAKKITAELFRLFFIAHHAIVSDSIRTGIHVPVPWDKQTALPSPPTLAADATVFATRVKTLSGVVATLCQSFSGWSTFSRETLKCACGPGMKLRDVNLEILVHTLLKTGSREHPSIRIMALAGIRSQNSSHLDHHYNFSKESRVAGDIRIVSSIEANIGSPGRDTLAHGEIITDTCAKEFNRDLFAATIQRELHAFLKKEEVRHAATH